MDISLNLDKLEKLLHKADCSTSLLGYHLWPHNILIPSRLNDFLLLVLFPKALHCCQSVWKNRYAWHWFYNWTLVPCWSCNKTIVNFIFHQIITLRYHCQSSRLYFQLQQYHEVTWIWPTLLSRLSFRVLLYFHIIDWFHKSYFWLPHTVALTKQTGTWLMESVYSHQWILCCVAKRKVHY